MEIVKNIKKNEVIDFTKEVTYLENQIVSKTIVQDKQKSITIFSFDKGMSIVMENGLPHSVYAKEKFKMILTVVFKYE